MRAGVPGGNGRGVTAWRRVGVDIGFGVLCAAMLAFWWSRIAESWGPGYGVVDAVASGAVCGLAVVRRRHRVGCAAAGLAIAAAAILVAYLAHLPSEPGPATVLGLSVLVGSAVAVSPPRTAGAVAAGGLAVAFAGLLTAHVPGVPPVVVLNGAGWLAAVGYGSGAHLLAARRRATSAWIRREERNRLARDLHDVVGHHLTRIVLQSQAAQVLARRSMPDPPPAPGSRLGPPPADPGAPAAPGPPGATGGAALGDPGAAEAPRRPAAVPVGVDALAGIEAAGTEALGALRRVVGLLRDDAEAGSGTPGPPRLADLVGGFEGPAVRLNLAEGEEATWPGDLAAAVYRIVQESLTNVARHAPQARSVTVGVTRRHGTVVVEITDDAPPGPARPPGSGHGLVGMRERVEALGGEVHAGPRPGVGWSVRAVLPVRGAR